jgi:hypothetical protein
MVTCGSLTSKTRRKEMERQMRLEIEELEERIAPAIFHVATPTPESFGHVVPEAAVPGLEHAEVSGVLTVNS